LISPALLDRQVTRREFPRLKELVRSFGDFVDLRTNSTLPARLDNLTDPNRANLKEILNRVPLEVWHDRWHFYSCRLKDSGIRDFRNAIDDFHSLIGHYIAFGVRPIFGALSKGIRGSLTDEEKSSLNGFQQDFFAFVSAYESFAKNLSRYPALSGVPRHVQHYNPL
jgi:hypothetical protein